VAYAYDADGNLNSVSNPYRSGGTVSNTVSAFDALARPTKIVDSDGSSQQLASYSGNAVTTTDEAGKQRELFIDGLGRTKEVLEPDSSGSLTLETDYLYSQNPTAGSGSTFTTYQSIVNQKGGSGSSSNWRTRTFTLDMLGRTASEATPEAGTVSYTYPNVSTSCAGIATLACGRTDANSTSTTYSYDALNRLTGKTYGGSSIGTGTPSVTYHYDQSSYNGLTISNGDGAMTGMSDSSGNITAWSFDGMGRVTAIEKTINSVTKSASYTYNADGSTNTVQDFGGTTFTYSYDVSGRPISIVDGSSNSYASSALYDAAGQLTSLNHQLTSGGGAYVRTLNYNTRLQPSFIGAKLNGSNIQSLTYGYGTGGTNNGNILTILNGMNSTRNQTYAYDKMNRLASGQDAGCHWGETYTYDNWGNLYQTTPITGCSGGYNWTATATTKNQLSTLTYDSAGEVTQDQYGNNFTYDAEGRILTGGGGTYVYDGAGNRVEKTVSGTATLYWPGAGSILDESSTSGSPMRKQVQFDGLLIWHEDSLGNGLFLFHDQIGSIRITGNASGSLADDNDYQSYGTLYHNYGSSSGNIYLFTGYESDSETTSDYATFRNLGLEMGRFNRPDPYDGSYDPANPQSLNRYSYALNSPLVYIDPSGLDETCLENGGGDDDDDTSPENVAPCPGGGGDSSGGANAPTIVVVVWDWSSYWSWLAQNSNAPGLSWFSPSITANPLGHTGGGGASNNAWAYEKKAIICNFQAEGAAAKEGGVSLALDAVGFIPGEGLLNFAAQTGVGLVSTVISANENDAFGAQSSLAGTFLMFAGTVYKSGAVGKAIPILGIGVNTIATLHDLGTTISAGWNAVNACMSQP
jgi:RHS repeat-associated protein